MRYKMTCAYDGRNYAGFQSQKNGVAIQDVIEGVLYRITHQHFRIIMSSRTDAGVHAKGQVFHFDLDKEYEPYRLKGSMNALLPKDIHILDAEIVPESFHARFSVTSKTYEYLINTGEYDVFLKGYAYQCFYKLDIPLIEEAAKLFEGKRDFGSFSTASYEEIPDQVREIYECTVSREGDLLRIRITGDGFLRSMVRLIVGTLIDLGRGKKSLEEVKKMLETPDKHTRRYNIDPNGLYLMKIRYEKQ